MQNISELLFQHAKDKTRPDGSPYKTLLHQDEIAVAKKTGLLAKEIQLAALENGITPERYCRNQKTLANTDQIKLLQSHVAVIGQGGLGGTVTEILCRIGIGNLTLVDGDTFEDSNLNRQLLSSVENLGRNKAIVASERVKTINPAINVIGVTDFFTSENGIEILEKADLAVDCLDSISDRFILENGCNACKIPLVSAAIGGTSGQATVIFPGDKGLCQIYGEPDSAPQKGIEARLGTLPFAAVYMAAVECAEVVNILCKNYSKLQNCLLITDISEQSLENISFAKR